MEHFTLDDVTPGDLVVFQDPIAGITLSGAAGLLNPAVVLREVTQPEISALSGTYGVLSRTGVVALWVVTPGGTPTPVDLDAILSVIPASKASDVIATLLPLQA